MVDVARGDSSAMPLTLSASSYRAAVMHGRRGTHALVGKNGQMARTSPFLIKPKSVNGPQPVPAPMAIATATSPSSSSAEKAPRLALLPLAVDEGEAEMKESV